MAKKKIKTIIKVFPMGGAATPAPPIGPALGQHGVNIMEFVNQYNKATQDKKGQKIPAEITIFEDRTFTFVLKTPPASELLKKAAGVQKGSGKPLTDKVGKVTRAQVREIAEKKMPDLNANDVDAAMRIIEGTVRNMGLTIEEK